MGAGGRDVGLMKLAQVTTGSVQLLLLRFRGLTLAVEQGVVAALQPHQFLDHFAKVSFVRGGVQSLGDLDDARLKTGFGDLELIDVGPGSGFDGFALIFRQASPLLVERG